MTSLKFTAALAALALSACASTGASKPAETSSAPARALPAGLDPASNPDPFPSTYRPLPSRPTAIVGATVLTATGQEIAGGTHREATFAELDRLVAELELVCATRAAGDEARTYDLAASLVDLAGFFNTGAFYDAAYSLCDLADRTRLNGLWRWDAIEVHVQALRLLQLAGLGNAFQGAAALLAGLRRVAASTGLG